MTDSPPSASRGVEAGSSSAFPLTSSRSGVALGSARALLAVRAATPPDLRPTIWGIAMPAGPLAITEDQLRDAEQCADEEGADLAAYLVACVD